MPSPGIKHRAEDVPRTQRKEETGGKSDCLCCLWTRAWERLHQRYPCVFLRAGDLQFIQGKQGESRNAPVFPSGHLLSMPFRDLPEAGSQDPAGQQQSHGPGHGCNQPEEKCCRGLLPGSCGAARSPPPAQRAPWGQAAPGQGSVARGQAAGGAPRGLRAGLLTPCRRSELPCSPRKCPRSSCSPSTPPRRASAPLPAPWCLPGSPGPAQPSCSPAASPSPGPAAAPLRCGGCHDTLLGAGCCPPPAYLLPALICEQPECPGLAGPPGGGGGGRGEPRPPTLAPRCCSVTSQPRRAMPSARPPQRTPVARELLNLHTAAFPSSTRVWKEQEWRRVDPFWEATWLMGVHRHSALASQKPNRIKSSVRRLHKKANFKCLDLLLFLSGSVLARN